MYWNAVGFAFFMFEGIGCLMPIMKETEKPQEFPKIIIAGLATLCFFFVSFSLVCYYAWGQDLVEPVVTEMLPVDNFIV
jgi:amino acid permease